MSLVYVLGVLLGTGVGASAGSDVESGPESPGLVEATRGAAITAAPSYDEGQVRVDERDHVVDGQTRRELEFSRGKYRRPIDAEAFYRAVGRSDLAERHLENERLRSRLALGAVVFGLGGVTLAAAMIAADCGGPRSEWRPGAPPPSNCTDGGPLVIGATGLIAALGFAVASWQVNPHPVPPHELRRLADEHNQRLKLGAAPYAAPGGGGLAVSGRF